MRPSHGQRRDLGTSEADDDRMSMPDTPPSTIADSRRRHVQHTVLFGITTGLAARLAILLCGIASLVVTARLLGPAEFGIYAVVLAVCNLVILAADAWINNSLVQRVDLDADAVASAEAALTAIGCFGALLVLGVAPLLEAQLDARGLFGVACILAVALPLEAASSFRTALLYRELRFQAAQVATVANAFANLVAAVAGALAGFGALALALGFTAGQVAEYAVVRICERTRLEGRPGWRSLHPLLDFGNGYVVAAVANYAALQGQNIVIGLLTSAGAVGLFSRAHSIMMVPVNLVAGAGRKVAFATVARLQDEPGYVREQLQLLIGLSALLILPVGVGLALSAPILVAVVLGPNWEGVVVPLAILFLALFARLGYVLPEAALIGMGLVWAAARRQIVYAAVATVATLAGTLQFGLAGAAAGFAVAATTVYVLSIGAARAFIGSSRASIIIPHIRAALVALLALGIAELVIAATGQPRWGFAYMAGYWSGLGACFTLAPSALLGEARRARTAVYRALRRR
jgi:O-antigen/teichoic acid export membrane protein